jgi:hypothetical protein
MATRVDTLEPVPVPEPERPPERKLSPSEWAKENLFSSRLNGALTVVFGLLLGWAVFRLLQFVFVDARWEIIERNLRLLLVFRFPREETWRLWTASRFSRPPSGSERELLRPCGQPRWRKAGQRLPSGPCLSEG